VSKTAALLVGFASLLLLTWATVALRQGPIEQDLVERVERSLSLHGISGLSITARGRELRLAGDPGGSFDADYVTDIARRVWGVRSVDDTGLRGDPATAEADAESADGLEVARIVRLGGNLANPMNAQACQRTMARLASVSTLKFHAGSATPLLESYPVLNDLATVAYQCPRTQIVIGGHIDDQGDDQTKLRLSQARAEAVERFFHIAGIDPARTRVVAYGDSRPIASNATPEGRAANRRITFDIVASD
jgi:outer membrane protein OmpA-like peptidoglycan-associated protein